MATPSFASASLYVGDLNNDVNDNTLYEIFSQVGQVASIRICRDAVSRRSLGYAYVNFHSVADAERALDTLNFSPIKGRPCRVMWSQRDPSVRKSGVGNVFIKNLEKSIDNKQLYDTFSMFGNILSAKIAHSPLDGQSLGYGFVHFDTDEAALKAIAQVNGMEIKDRNIVVVPFKPKSDPSRAPVKSTNVYVKNIPDELNSKEKLDAMFSEFGTITNSVLSASSGSDGTSRPFAFVNFQTAEQASAAIEALNEKEVVPGVQLYVARAQKKAEREKELRERFESINAAKQQVGVNLYVKNLSDEMTDEELCAEFSKFGGITSFKIMRDDTTGRSRGFGFVCFTSADDSTRAITEMNGRMVQNKPLYVAVAQRKDARRAQLEMMRAKAMMPAGMYPPGPMFYPPPSQGGPRAGPGGFMYPPMMPPNMRFPAGGRPFMGPAGNAPRGAPPGYMLVPAPLPNLAGGAGAAAAGAAAGARQPRQPRPQQGGPAQPRQPMAAGARQGGRGQARGAVVPGGAQPLTLSSLVNASPEMQKQMIGERLYPLIAAKQPEQAGKITGMLLEMDNAELLELLDSDEARDSKIVEAMRVLLEAEGTPQ